MDFKSFINEEFGLANLGGQINRVFDNPSFKGQTGAYVSTDYSTPSPTGYAGDPTSSIDLPANSLTIPNVEKTGRIAVLLYKKNPIYIRLTDGTEAFFTYDEYHKIQGEPPAVGKTMTIVFQRHPNDASEERSKIVKAIVRD